MIPQYHEEEDCAEVMNKYFSSVFTRGSVELNGIEVRTPTNYPDIPDVTFESNTIEKEIKVLDTSKSTGPDGIPALVLKRFYAAFTPILKLIFEKSYAEGRVPQKMKMAKVTPIYKSGDKTSPSNYRPVSITDVIAKVFEKVIKIKLEKHVEENHILSNNLHLQIL